jgi:hypothetical protein
MSSMLEKWHVESVYYAQGMYFDTMLPSIELCVVNCNTYMYVCVNVCRSKSTKLAEAFDLLDEDGDGCLSRRGLWMYFRSFLCVLLVMIDAPSALTNNDLTRIADGTALIACDSVLSLSLNGNSSVTFDDVADWYTTTGYHIAPWLELLDMSKWQHLINSD